MSAALRQAARELLQALDNSWLPGGADRTEDAAERLEAALAEPSTDELLRRLTHPPCLELRITYGTTWMARISGAAPPVYELAEDPAAALRAVLLRLPAPTEPPESE